MVPIAASGWKPIRGNQRPNHGLYTASIHGTRIAVVKPIDSGEWWTMCEAHNTRTLCSARCIQ